MKRFLAIVFVLAFAGFGSVRELSAQATVSSFMLVPGIKGESKDVKHKDWIDLISISETLDQVTKKKTACEVQVTKFLDSSGPLLWAAAVTGQIFPDVQIEVQRTSAPQQIVYQIRMINAVVTSVSTSTNGTFPIDTVTLLANSAILTYTPLNPDGSAASPVTATLNCN